MHEFIIIHQLCATQKSLSAVAIWTSSRVCVLIKNDHQWWTRWHPLSVPEAATMRHVCFSADLRAYLSFTACVMCATWDTAEKERLVERKKKLPADLKSHISSSLHLFPISFYHLSLKSSYFLLWSCLSPLHHLLSDNLKGVQLQLYSKMKDIKSSICSVMQPKPI